MVTVKSPSEVLTVNVSPVRSVMTPLFLTLSPEEAPNAGATTKANTVERHAAIAVFLLNIINSLQRGSSVYFFMRPTRSRCYKDPPPPITVTSDSQARKNLPGLFGSRDDHEQTRNNPYGQAPNVRFTSALYRSCSARAAVLTRTCTRNFRCT